MQKRWRLKQQSFSCIWIVPWLHYHYCKPYISVPVYVLCSYIRHCINQNPHPNPSLKAEIKSTPLILQTAKESSKAKVPLYEINTLLSLKVFGKVNYLTGNKFNGCFNHVLVASRVRPAFLSKIVFIEDMLSWVCQWAQIYPTLYKPKSTPKSSF